MGDFECIMLIAQCMVLLMDIRHGFAAPWYIVLIPTFLYFAFLLVELMVYVFLGSWYTLIDWISKKKKIKSRKPRVPVPDGFTLFSDAMPCIEKEFQYTSVAIEFMDRDGKMYQGRCIMSEDYDEYDCYDAKNGFSVVPNASAWRTIGGDS